jgi:hypothetical protein
MADQGFTDAPLDLDADYEDIPDAADQFASAIAEQARHELEQRTDPMLLQRAAEEEAQQAQMSIGAAEVVERYPWATEESAARYLVGEARAAAVALGDASLGENPAFWGDVASAIESGARGDAIPRVIAEQRVKGAIMSGGEPERLGTRALPFG